MNNSFKHDASTSHAEIVIRLKGPPQSSHNPVNGLSGQPSNYVHIWTVPTTIKRRATIPARMACCSCLSNSTSVGVATTYKHSEKGESLEQRAVAQHVDNRQGENRKMASCFTLLKRITRLKIVNSEIKLRIHSPTWQGIPRRVHATVTNPAWITHLLRTTIANSDVECILRAKALQLYLTGMGRWKDLRKYRKVSLAIAIARCSKLEAATSLSTKPNRSPTLTDCENHTGIEVTTSGNLRVWVWFETVWKNDMPALGLAGCHWREMKIGAGTQIGVPICITRSNGRLRW